MTDVLLLTAGTGPASGWPGSERCKPKRRPSTYALKYKDAVVLMDAGSVEAVSDVKTLLGKVDAALLSHAHNDHWAGLNALRWGPKLPVFLSEETLKHPYFAEMRDAPFSLSYVTVRPFESFEVGDLEVTPFPLNHMPGTLGYLVKGSSSVAYALDTKGMPEESVKFLKEQGVEYLIIDSALPPGADGGHNTYEDAIKIAKELDVKVAFLVHLLPTVDEAEVLKKAEEEGVNAVVPFDMQSFWL